MTDWIWILTLWALVAAGLVLWFGEALGAFVGPGRPRRDPSACGCCRHDAIAHEHAGTATNCTQCPCDGFRGAG